jgi:hypothetical protein
MDPYDKPGNENDGFGTRSSDAPDFEPPKTYSHAPEIADSEAAATQRGSDADDEVTNSTTEKEQDALHKNLEGGYYRPDKNKQQKSSNKSANGAGSFWSRLSTKRKVQVAGIAAGLVTGVGIVGIALPGIESLQILHYSQTLQSIMKPHTLQNESKISKFYRSMTDPNNPGRTRLSFLQNVNHTKLMKALNDQGFKITSDSRFGRMGVVSMDVEKTKYKGMSAEEARAAVAEDYNVPKGKITTSGSGTKLNVSFRNLPSGTQNAILESMVRSSGKGKIASFFMLRHLRSYYNVPDLFHPLRKPAGAVQDWINLKANALSKKLNERLQEKTAAAQEKMNAFREKYGGPMAVAGAAISLAGIACMIVDASNEIHDINMQTFSDPGAQSGAEAVAYGDQVSDPKSDIPYQLVDATNSNFYDSSGHSVFDSNSIRSLSGMGTIGNSTDYTKNYQQQYSVMQQGFAYSNSISSTARAITSNFVGKGVCNPVGEALMTALGAILLVASAPSGGALVVEVIKTTAISVAIGAGMNAFVQTMSTKMPELVVHQGPLGGDFDAMGFMTGANAVTAAAGGTVASGTATKEIMQQVAIADRAEAQKQSLFTRVFSPTNNNSFIAKLVDNVNTQPSAEAHNIASSFLNIGTSLVKLPSTIVTARAHAATPTYTVGNIPLIAYSQAVMDINDPVANGDEVASIMSSPANSLAYTNKALICHGTKLGETTDASGATYYDAQNVQKVDPGSDAYQTAGCDDTSDKNWVKIQSFIGDVEMAESLSCTIANYDDSCSRMGVGSTTATPGSDSTDTSGAIGAPNTSTGRSQGAWGGYSNGKIPESAMTKITASFLGVSSGDTIQICNTKMSNPYLNPSAAVSIKALNDAFKQKYGHMMYFQSCYRDIAGQEYAKAKYGSGAATVGTSNHGWGLAVDIGPNPKKDQGCDSSSSNLTAAEKEMCQWITDNAPKYGWKNGKDVVPSEQWHFEYSRNLPTGSGS